MAGLVDLLEDLSEKEIEEARIEALAIAVQVALQRSMEQKSVTKKELARRLNLSQARVSQIIGGDGPNLTLKTIGRIAHALDEDFELVTKSEAAEIFHRGWAQAAATPARYSAAGSPWKERPANTNKRALREAA